MKKTPIALAALFFALAAFSVQAAAQSGQKIPGQKSMLLIEDTFKLVPGTWALYDVLDKEKNEPFLMAIAVLGRETYKGKDGVWLEIEVRMKDMPVVVTGALVDEAAGPSGEVLKAVVQVEGASPFKVPEKYLKGEGQEVGQFEPAKIVRKLEQKKIVHKGRTVDCLVVEAENDQGQKVSATVSVQIPPIAIYAAETDDLRMTVSDWGTGAQTKLKGEPVSMTLWLIEMVGKELGKIK
ncbi:MAG: hypothetical protein FJY82_04565 [Candidatus Aminicenantes bacterium]|nr:hypothetical protein [Candidatus Aminicenantes bacterium]